MDLSRGREWFRKKRDKGPREPYNDLQERCRWCSRTLWCLCGVLRSRKRSRCRSGLEEGKKENA
jgi:hypothetical protein